ncbi:hypothetical protein ACFWJM_33070 [Streptomyces sp. NPDC127077]|uniref:hypothetical protein n=1 Tax=Streptomyces sp. NPDC127077 TaxID=3347131 RepID=UPI0036642562
MAPFDEVKFRSDEAGMRADLKKYNLHKDPAFMQAFDGYMDQLHLNGQWLNKGYQPDPSWSGDAANNLITQFDRLNALHVPADWWRANRKNENFDRMRDEKARETFDKKYLWSKTEPYYPARQAAKAGGLILETSPPGKIFNGRNCGFENWSDAQVQADLWTYMSNHYVDGTRGPVEAVMLGGRVDNSVLTKYEWPHLRERIEAGLVTNMHVKVMGIRNDSQESKTWSLETRATYNVHSQNSFDQIPAPDDPQFADKQNRWRNQEKARNASKSSASSSTSQESAASGHSLKTFHKAFDDPNAVVVLADPATGRAVGTESPNDLSQVVSRQLTRVDTNASLQGAGRAATVAAVQAELQAQAAAAHTLDQKLAAFQEEQQRRASTSAWPGTPDYGAQLSQGMTGLDLGSSAANYSPTADYSPTAGYSPTAEMPTTGGYFPPGGLVAEQPHYTYPLQPVGTGQGYSFRQSESPDQEEAFAYPPSPVGNTEMYHPSYTNTERHTPSTGSASSEFGEPLARAPRNPSPPSSTPAQSSSSGKKAKEPKAKEPKAKEPKAGGGFGAWVRGDQYRKKSGGPSKR